MAPSVSHGSGSRAIKIPMHGNAEGTRHHSSARRRRSAANRITKHDHGEFSDHGKASPNGSDAWLSADTQTDPGDSYHPRQTAVASPSNVQNLIGTPSAQQKKDKQRANSHDASPPNNISSLFQTTHSPLGPSMISSSSYKSINLNAHMGGGDTDEPARLITYTKHSQGFTWNDELFLPSYLVGRYRYSGRGGSRKHRFGGEDMMGEDDGIGDFDEEGEKCPVTDIFVTDEEAAAMMP